MIFGIETSCDETSTAIVDLQGNVLSHIIVGQEEHKKYGGVVPEIASRSHLQLLQKIIPKTLSQAKISIDSIKAFCATCGPGLIGGLLIGSTIAKSLAISKKKPFYPINHLEGHALSVQINSKISFPFVLLLITGGHTQFYFVKNIGSYKLLGSTVDDSVGEAFDKVAKMIDMPYPGGPYVENRAKKGKDIFNFPSPLISNKNLNFSFSGLKTAVRYEIKKTKIIDNEFKNNICASFQKTTINILLKKSENAIIFSKKKFPELKNFVLAGGVAANKEIIKSFKTLCNKHNLQFNSPPAKLCGDNAAMIAWACLQRYKLGYKGDLNFKPRARWNLDEI